MLRAARWHHRIFALVAIGCAFALPAASQAQPAGDVPSDEYRQHMDNGVKLYADKNYEAAIAEFQAAYRARPKASPLVNISLCHKGLFAYPKAIVALETALAKHAGTMSDADRKAAADAIVEMRGLLAWVRVQTAPPNAVVTIDGEDLPAGATASPVPLGPGKHEIAARADGFTAASTTVTVVSGERDRVARLVLVPSHGWVSIKTNDPRTNIAIDDKPMGTGSWSGFVQPGVHRVHLYRAGAAGEMREIRVVAGKIQEVLPGAGGAVVPAPSAPPLPVRAGPDLPPAPKPVRRDPPMNGFYGLVTGSLLAPLAHPERFVSPEAQSGAAAGLRAGYRVNTPAAFEGMFEYGNVTVNTTTEGEESSYSLSSVRLGLNLRLMSPGRTIRFVGAIGGGVSIDDLEYTLETGDACSGCQKTSASDPYFLSELGLELDVGGVLVGAMFVSYFQATKGLGKSAYGNRPLIWAGGGLRVGYGTW